MVRLPSDEVTAAWCSSMQARKILGHQRLNWPQSGSQTLRTRFGPEPDPRFGVRVRGYAEPEPYQRFGFGPCLNQNLYPNIMFAVTRSLKHLSAATPYQRQAPHHTSTAPAPATGAREQRTAVAAAAAGGVGGSRHVSSPQVCFFYLYFIHTDKNLPPPDSTTTKPDREGRQGQRRPAEAHDSQRGPTMANDG